MKTLVFATGNHNKLKEIKEMLPEYEILSLKDIGFDRDIDESADTTSGNAQIKVDEVLRFCHEKNLDYGVFGDDTGLFIRALNGNPGVHSARFGGIDHGQPQLRRYVLDLMHGKEDRAAYFECSVAYKDKDVNMLFIGRAYGEITEKEIGSKQFGYDPIFYSLDLGKTFGEAEGEEKNSVSHRGKAIRQFQEFLKLYMK